MTIDLGRWRNLNLQWPDTVRDFAVGLSYPYWINYVIFVAALVVAIVNLVYTYRQTNRTQWQLVFAWIWFASIAFLVFFRRFQTFEFVFIVAALSLGFSIANVVELDSDPNHTGTELAYAYVWVVTSSLALLLSPIADVTRI